jgi:hypothetical protein
VLIVDGGIVATEPAPGDAAAMLAIRDIAPLAAAEWSTIVPVRLDPPRRSGAVLRATIAVLTTAAVVLAAILIRG